LETLPTETIRKICYGNAAALYHHPAPPSSMMAESVLLGSA
jgi:hypothetical protein